ncbi:MAG TPA: DNA-formamidopyrimidine glycosylase family protein [Acidimicrobiales bacterium]|nr:DNA-formamidopyrimidine glycosylase family protein [Acidimicrobiales bacterium]
MPELPEVRAHAERLDRDLAGAALQRFVPLSFTALKTFDPAPEVAVDHPLAYVGQRGKHLLLDFGVATFVVHLMQGGRLRLDAKQAAKPRNGVARWVLADGRALLLTEAGTERKAGVWVVSGDPEPQPPLDRLGPDADGIGVDAMTDLLAQHSARLHGFLRDQHVLAGLGRRLANEVCHRARLSPFAPTSKMGQGEAERIVEAIAACVAEGLAFERGRDDMSASKERPGAVHHRKDQECPDCGDVIRAVEYRSYEVAYCPACQTGGKVLADNTTSKFLK